MKESSQIALTFAKSFLSRVERENNTLQDGHMHLHVPEVVYNNAAMLRHVIS